LEGASAKIEALIQTGSGFTYENFASRSERGYPAAFGPEWVSWRARVEGAINALFDEGSAPVRMIAEGSRVPVIGNGPDKFDLAMAHFMGALDTARTVLIEDTFGELQGARTAAPLSASNRVFVVHGHDEKAKSELEIILAEMGLDPVVLHRQPDGGKTIIEKFEHYSDVGFAFVLMTPDEVAYLTRDEAKDDNQRKKEYRARPNVIFEFGYFVGKLGRDRTCCLLRGDVVPPSDINGLIYKQFSSSVEEVAYAIGKELKQAGYKLK
jgi:predicted nucleotide-binding protein